MKFWLYLVYMVTICCTADALLIFFCFREGLKANGVIVVKENLTSSGDIELDEQDSSVTR